MNTVTKIAGALAVGCALVAGAASASGWWNNGHDRYYDRWGGPWYGYGGYGGPWGYGGGPWGYRGGPWGGGYPGYGYGQNRVQVITVPTPKAPPPPPPVH
jgi:hypothetical protein